MFTIKTQKHIRVFCDITWTEGRGLTHQPDEVAPSRAISPKESSQASGMAHTAKTKVVEILLRILEYMNPLRDSDE